MIWEKYKTAHIVGNLLCARLILVAWIQRTIGSHSNNPYSKFSPLVLQLLSRLVIDGFAGHSHVVLGIKTEVTQWKYHGVTGDRQGGDK